MKAILEKGDVQESKGSARQGERNVANANGV